MHAQVEDKRVSGMMVGVMRHGKLCYLDKFGRRNDEKDLPVEEDTVFRIYSMTKVHSYTGTILR